MLFRFLRRYSRHRVMFRTYSSAEQLTGVSCIEIKNPSYPSYLVCEWLEEAKHFGLKTDVMSLATSNHGGTVSNKNVFIKEILPEVSLTFMAVSYSTKIKNIEENPQVATTILMNYNNGVKDIVKQMSLMGNAQKLPREKCQSYFESETLPRKMAYWLSQDCKSSDWNDLKGRHDRLFKEFIELGQVPPMPTSVVAYKLVPSQIEFYYSSGSKVGDRIVFVLGGDNKWKYERLSP